MSFSISHHMQNLMCYLGQSKVFAEASEILDETLQLDVSAMQIHRVSKYYGELLDPLIAKNKIDYIPKLEDVAEEDDVYIMVDGSMLYTRDDDCK